MPTTFGGSHQTVFDFLSRSPNFTIPEYQREFSWSEDNVDQLIDDIAQGVSKLEKSQPVDERRDSGSKFLGCIIHWDREAVANEDYHPVTSINYISRVYELIDGQQRVSTITLLLCELYFQIESIIERLDDTINEEKSLIQFLEHIQDSWLLTRFSRTGSSGASPARRPSIIRQGTDKWIHSGAHKYESSISLYVHNILVTLGQGRPLTQPIDLGADIKSVATRLKMRLEDYAESDNEILDAKYDQTELFSEMYAGRNPVDIERYLATNPANKTPIGQAISLIAFTHYLLNYCAFTVIKSPNQDTALDMFQSLNATGVQLTAVQLLKPLVSHTFRSNATQFKNSQTFILFEEVNNWLNSGRNSSKKTHTFFLKFGLAIFGDEPLNSLSSQRSWLLRTYREFTSNGTDLDKAEEFVRIMKHCVDYLDAFYFQNRETLFQDSPPPHRGSRSTYDQFKLVHLASSTSYMLSPPAITCMMFLIDSKHDLAHSFLVLFYTKFQEVDAAAARDAKDEFEKMVLKVSACFVLWRALFPGKYPDSAYRKILGTLSYNRPGFDGKAKIMHRPLISELMKGLDSASVSRRDIKDRFSSGLKYRQGALSLIRFVLILAADNRVPRPVTHTSPTNHGLVEFDVSGPDYIFPDIWLGAEYKSIEHVAPQKLLGHSGSTVPEWSNTFTNASDSIHSIGNLTLLSIGLNASVPEDTQSKKDHYEGLVSPGAARGVTPTASSLMSSSPFLGHLVPVYLRLAHWLHDLSTSPTTPSQNEWNEEFIDRRAKNIGYEVFGTLIHWIRAD